MERMMPHRFMPPYVGELMVAVMMAFIALAAEVLHSLGSGPIIYDAVSLRLLCLCGSVGGALVSVLIFPPKEGKGSPVRQMAIKFLASGLAAALFTPAIMRRMGIEMVGDYVLAMSGFVSIISVTLLQEVTPAVIGLIRRKVGLGETDALGLEAIRESREKDK